MTVLLLAGTGEGRALAKALADADIAAVASLAGATRAPEEQALPTRIGGFGGEDGFRQYLSDARITAVLDATHPFAQNISTRTAQVCADLGLPYCQVLRPAWTPIAGDNWTVIQHEGAAADHITADETVFLATGRQTLHRFACLRAKRVYCRQIDPPAQPFPFENGEFVIGRPPFSVEQEAALFRRLAIDWLVVKNAGGATSATKLTAARQLGLRVLMIARPDMPDALRVGTIPQALAWVRTL